MNIFVLFVTDRVANRVRNMSFHQNVGAVSPAVTAPNHYPSVLSGYHGEGTPSPGPHQYGVVSTARIYLEFHALSEDLVKKYRGHYLYLVSELTDR
jgi:hypothetical protein